MFAILCVERQSHCVHLWGRTFSLSQGWQREDNISLQIAFDCQLLCPFTFTIVVMSCYSRIECRAWTRLHYFFPGKAQPLISFFQPSIFKPTHTKEKLEWQTSFSIILPTYTAIQPEIGHFHSSIKIEDSAFKKTLYRETISQGTHYTK